MIVAGLAATTLAACGDNTGRGGTPTPDGGSASGAGRPSIAQWYHQYGEAGTQEAVERYAAEYDAADVTVVLDHRGRITWDSTAGRHPHGWSARDLEGR